MEYNPAFVFYDPIGKSMVGQYVIACDSIAQLKKILAEDNMNYFGQVTACKADDDYPFVVELYTQMEGSYRFVYLHPDFQSSKFYVVYNKEAGELRWTPKQPSDKIIFKVLDSIQEAEEWIEPRRKFQSVMHAFVDGASIEAENEFNKSWFNASTPAWDPDCHYRVKKEEKPIILRKDLARWLALGYGQMLNLYQDRVYTHFYYDSKDENVPVDREKFKVREWNETEWKDVEAILNEEYQ